MPKTQLPPSIQKLTSALAELVTLQNKVQSLATTITAEEAELVRLAEGDPDDAATVTRISALQARAAMLPGNKRKAEEATIHTAEAMREIYSSALNEMGALREAEAETIISAAERLLLPFAPPRTDVRNGEVTNVAREVARHLPKVRAVHEAYTFRSYWPSNFDPQNPGDFVAGCVASVREVLAAAERYTAQGGSFLSPSWSKA